MVFGRVRVRRAARGVDAGALAAELGRGVWLASARTLKDERGSWVKRARLGGVEVVVKCRRLGSTGDVLKAALGFGRADRHWFGAALLTGKKIATARPLLLGHARVGGVAHELLVLEALEGRTLLEWVAADARGEVGATLCRTLGASAGALVRRLSEAGLFNRDHKPSNQIVTDPDAGTISLIDCVAIRRTHAGIERMLAQLWIEAAGCGVPPRARMVARGLRAASGGGAGSAGRAERRELLEAARAIVQRHGDMRPSVDPLGDVERRG